ncbi:MAG: hypothetical protein KA433_03030 [Fermentimonas sp.]|nr:hypothetical protein [Fermentimonas sp.]
MNILIRVVDRKDNAKSVISNGRISNHISQFKDYRGTFNRTYGYYHSSLFTNERNVGERTRTSK